jgi:hypothetical protein
VQALEAQRKGARTEILSNCSWIVVVHHPIAGGIDEKIKVDRKMGLRKEASGFAWKEPAFKATNH